MTIIVKSGSTTDGKTLKAGDKLLLPPAGSITNAATINAAGQCLIGTPSESDKTSLVYAFSPMFHDVDGVRVARGADGVKLQNFAVNSTGSKVASAASVSGDKCAIRNVSQIGAGRLLTFTGASNLDAVGLKSTGTSSEYVCCAWDEAAPGIQTNNNCRLALFEFISGKGTPGTPGMNAQGCMHAARIEHSRNLTLGDDKLTLATGPGRGYAGYIKHFGWSAGSALNHKESLNTKLIRLLTQGSVGFRAGLDSDASIHPDWRLDGLLIDRCEMHVVRYCTFGHGCTNVTVKDSVFRAVADHDASGNYDPSKPHGSVFSFEGALGAWPASNGTFADCRFYGDRICDSSNDANMKAHWKFVRCFFNDKPI